MWCRGRGDATARRGGGRAQIYSFELFELVLLSKLDTTDLSVGQFEAPVSQQYPPSYYYYYYYYYYY